MSNLVTKVFEGKTIRTVDLGNGNFVIVAKDLSDAWNYRKSSDLTRLIDDDEKGAHIVRTPGGDQEMICITESGMYHAIFVSKHPEAKRFRRFVTEEILPEIRKTGSYKPKHKTDEVMIGLLAVGQALERIGVAPDIALACTLNAIELNTGVDMTTQRKALPNTTKVLASMNATAVGDRLGLTPIETNRLLRSRGLQFRNDRDEWELTDEGKQFGEAHPYISKGHSGYQILWKPSIIEFLNISN